MITHELIRHMRAGVEQRRRRAKYVNPGTTETLLRMARASSDIETSMPDTNRCADSRRKSRCGAAADLAAEDLRFGRNAVELFISVENEAGEEVVRVRVAAILEVQVRLA